MIALRRALLPLLATAMTLAGCGSFHPGMAGLAAARGQAVRDVDGWYKAWRDLENYEGAYGHQYESDGFDNLFYAPPVGNVVQPGTGSKVLELLAPAGEGRMRRGAIMTYDSDISTTGATQRVTGDGDNPVSEFAPHVLISWKWNTNAPAVPSGVNASLPIQFLRPDFSTIIAGPHRKVCSAAGKVPSRTSLQ